MKKPVTVVLVVLGLGLLLVSSLWPYLTSGQSHWGEEQQQDFADAMRHAHELEMRQTTGKRATASKEVQEQELAAARAHWETQQAKLAEAKHASQRPAAICFWTGIATMLAGVLAYRYLN